MPISKTGGARFQAASDQSLLVYFGQSAHLNLGRAEARPLQNHEEKSHAPDPVAINSARAVQNQITIEAHERVRRLLRLMELEPVAGVRNLHPAYCSLLVKFDAKKLRHEQMEEILRGYLSRMEEVNLPEPQVVEIPVCYGSEYGPDLNEVATMHGMMAAQVIELHASKDYLVYFLGFVPGFAYLGELPEALVTPRLAAPRRIVPAGSVGIAGNQTGVYPFVTPGGWRLLGRTPLTMFRTDREGLSLLSIGDRVRFVPISREQFVALERA